MAANSDIKNPDKIGAGDTFNMPDTPGTRAFESAASQLGSKDYAVSVSNGKFKAGANKCNLFVSEAYTKSGSSFPRRYKFGIFKRGPVTAGTLGGSSNLSNTSVVDFKNAKLGDVLAWPVQFSDATGHTAIFTGGVNIKGQSSTRGGWGSIGAGTFKVNFRDAAFFNSGDSYYDFTPTVRRVNQ